MKIVIDMNLSPEWVRVLSRESLEAVHWSAIGRADAPDADIFKWAAENTHVVFTHDLDFGAMLAVSGDHGPSVFQLRTADVGPEAVGSPS